MIELQKEYAAAKTDESKRERFVLALAFAFRELYSGSASELIYDPHGKIHRETVWQSYRDGILTGEELDYQGIVYDTANFSVFCPIKKIGTDAKSPVFIKKNSFNINSLDEFLNVLLDHELVHTEDMMNGVKVSDKLILNHKTIPKIRLGLWGRITEARAYENMRIQAENKGLANTETYLRAKKNVATNLQTVKDIGKSPYSDFEKEVALAFLDMFHQRQQHKTI